MASHPGIVFRVLTWNLFHGRDAPPDPATHVDVTRPLRREFLDMLAGWEWDLALLQEAPPRWMNDLERATGAIAVRSLTSRNWLGPLRAAIAEWRPDLIKSNEGGSNMLLVRPPLRIAAVGRLRLALWPERRTSLMAKLALPDGRELVAASTHLSVPATGRPPAEVVRAAARAVEWAGGDPAIFGGDLNLRAAEHPGAFDELRDRFGLTGPTGPKAIDHLLVRGLEIVEAPRRLAAAERELRGADGRAVRLSDHAPVTAAFRLR